MALLHRSGAAALLVASLWLLLTGRVALAQETPPGQEEAATGGAGGGSGGLVLGPLLEAFGQLPELLFRAVLRVFTDPVEGLPALLGQRTQAFLRDLWNALAGLFAPFNLFTQIPTWIVGAPFVEQAWGVLFPIASIALGLAAVLTLALAMVRVMGGQPPVILFEGLRHFMRATAGLLLGTRLCLTLVELSNSLAGRLMDPTGGLPGLGRMTAFGQAVSYPVLLVVYLVFALLYFFVRAKVVFIVVTCLILAPVAFVVGALPCKKAQDVYDVWLTFFLGATFVQVVQAVFLGLGANLLILGTSVVDQGPAQEAAAEVLGIMAIFAAGTVPQLLLGALLTRSLVPSRQLHTAARMGQQLASWVVWRVPVPPPASAYPAPSAPPYGHALTGGATPRVAGRSASGAGSGPPRLIEYVPPMLPPPT